MDETAEGIRGSESSFGSNMAERWRRLGAQARPAVPSGSVGELADRMLVYGRAAQASVVAPYVGPRRGGMIVVGPRPGRPMPRRDDIEIEDPVLLDPACYQEYVATPNRPFHLADDGLSGFNLTLEQELDRQIMAGFAAAMTPSGYFGPAGIESLRAAADTVHALCRTDTIFVVALDVSLLMPACIADTAAALVGAECPIGLVLGGQGDPLARSTKLIPALRSLALSVPLMPIRTDFNAFDLVAHGAFAGAIGTGGSLRHTVAPSAKPRAFHLSDPSPSVLFPEVLSWWKGSKIAKLYGAVPGRAARCACEVCDGQYLTRFLYREDQNEAVAHAVAVWSRMATDMMDSETMRQRGQYWQNVCSASVTEHRMIGMRLQRAEPLTVQRPLAQWAKLPAWPFSERADVRET